MSYEETPVVYQVSEEFAQQARLNAEQYARMYRRSIENPEDFWREQARQISWSEPFQTVSRTNFDRENFAVEWFADGQLNACYNCVDRHLASHADRAALIFVADEPGISRSITYAEVFQQVGRMANVLKNFGVRKGDRVVLYMPMTPEAIYGMLACARIGAIHSVVFGGFSPSALAGRINDCSAKLILTVNEAKRGGRTIGLQKNVDEAVRSTPCVETILVVQSEDTEASVLPDQRYHWWHDAAVGVSHDCPVEPMKAEDPLFILYTSGSTGTPKGLLHTTGGYMVWTSMTFRYSFDYRDSDVFWCTADVGWITGHSYVVYGPMANAATQVVFEGTPTYPDASRLWQEVDRHGVTVLYTAPTAVRALMREGDGPLATTRRSSLRLLASVGEPINPEAWLWFYHKVGHGRCPIVDTWWQTETGGHMLAPLPGAHPMKPGSATLPYFGVVPALLDSDGREIEGPGAGALVIKQSWPGQARSIYGDQERMLNTYFDVFPGYYASSDAAERDADGFYWLTGRMDDVINVSGHRLGTAEIESALVAHESVSEAAVVGMPHPIKGQGIYAFVALVRGVSGTDPLCSELVGWVRKQIGPVATPDVIQFVPDMPKTRSGKIMRRILRKIAAGETDELGDVSTLADPLVVSAIIDGAITPSN